MFHGNLPFKNAYTIGGGLPKTWYEKAKDLKAGLGMTDRQLFVMALWALCELGTKDPKAVNAAALSVRERYPSRKKKGEDPLFYKPNPTGKEADVVGSEDEPGEANQPAIEPATNCSLGLCNRKPWEDTQFCKQHQPKPLNEPQP